MPDDHDDRGRSGVPRDAAPAWNHSSHGEFYDYYAEKSQSETKWRHFRSIRDTVLRAMTRHHSVERPLNVVDIGCNAGTMCMAWAELGHNVHGLDVSEPLIELGRKRAASAGYTIDLQIGSAVELPWTDESMDVCVCLELLEHVADWERCLSEIVRVLQPGGMLYLATSNKLCPKQQEFNLPLYSWYPARLKRYIEHLAVTTRPDLANFATYPAVNWFSFYSLRAALVHSDFECLDRFDAIDIRRKGTVARVIVASIRAISVLRWLAHVATPGTIVIARKRGEWH